MRPEELAAITALTAALNRLAATHEATEQRVAANPKGYWKQQPTSGEDNSLKVNVNPGIEGGN